MPTQHPIIIENDVPFFESRGRPVSPEYAALVKLRDGQSFTSKKSRDSLYQIARNLGFRVSIMWAGDEEGWRVWKRGRRNEDPALLAERDARRRLQRQRARVRRRKGRK
jgi:hypothetical protein